MRFIKPSHLGQKSSLPLTSSPQNTKPNQNIHPVHGKNPLPAKKEEPFWQWLYGIHPVKAALRARRRKTSRLVLRKGSLSTQFEQLRHMAKESGVAVHHETPSGMDVLCKSTSHQGVALYCGAPPTQPEALAWSFVNAKLGRPGPPLVLVLDQVLDPRNLGAIVRSAAAFAAQAVVVPKRRSAPLSPVASKASAGALEQFPIIEVNNLAQFIQQAARYGFWNIAAVVQGGAPLKEHPKDRPLMLVIGSEGRGVRPLVQRRCDATLTLNMHGQGHLNVSNAATVLLHWFTS